jgi:hypothetical protein
MRRSAPGSKAATWCKVLTDGSSSKKPMTLRRAGPVTQAGRRRELGSVSTAAMGDADEVVERQLGGTVMSTCARRTNDEVVRYSGHRRGGEGRRLPWR